MGDSANRSPRIRKVPTVRPILLGEGRVHAYLYNLVRRVGLVTNHDLAMMRLAGRAQFDAMTGGNAIQICRRHPGTVKRLAQFARRWLARGAV
jgi:hypothetical protein